MLIVDNLHSPAQPYPTTPGSIRWKGPDDRMHQFSPMGAHYRIAAGEDGGAGGGVDCDIFGGVGELVYLAVFVVQLRGNT